MGRLILFKLSPLLVGLCLFLSGGPASAALEDSPVVKAHPAMLKEFEKLWRAYRNAAISEPGSGAEAAHMVTQAEVEDLLIKEGVSEVEFAALQKEMSTWLAQEKSQVLWQLNEEEVLLFARFLRQMTPEQILARGREILSHHGEALKNFENMVRLSPAAANYSRAGMTRLAAALFLMKEIHLFGPKVKEDLKRELVHVASEVIHEMCVHMAHLGFKGDWTSYSEWHRGWGVEIYSLFEKAGLKRGDEVSKAIARKWLSDHHPPGFFSKFKFAFQRGVLDSHPLVWVIFGSTSTIAGIWLTFVGTWGIPAIGLVVPAVLLKSTFLAYRAVSAEAKRNWLKGPSLAKGLLKFQEDPKAPDDFCNTMLVVL